MSELAWIINSSHLYLISVDLVGAQIISIVLCFLVIVLVSDLKQVLMLSNNPDHKTIYGEVQKCVQYFIASHFPLSAVFIVI